SGFRRSRPTVLWSALERTPIGWVSSRVQAVTPVALPESREAEGRSPEPGPSGYKQPDGPCAVSAAASGFGSTMHRAGTRGPTQRAEYITIVKTVKHYDYR